MRELTVFNHISLDGYFTDAEGDMSWAHKGSDDPEFAEFTRGNAQGDGTMVFGRVTYELMARFWPTEMAMKSNPQVAKRMNDGEKIVFSRTLRSASWQNTRLIKDDPVTAISKLKAEDGPGMVIMGSGTIVTQLAGAGLVDEFQIIVNPLALGAGRTLFEGLKERLRFTLTNSRAFNNGKVFLTYVPA